MATYNDCYNILQDVRIGINEWNPGLVKGTDTTGVFPNSYIINKINQSQQFIWNIVFQSFPEYFLTSASLSISSSVATLPADCYKIRRIEDSDGNKISPMNVDEKHISSTAGSRYHYYRYGNTLRVDEDNISGTYTIWYFRRCREITTGMSSAGGSKSLTLATTARKEADYYNNMLITNVDDDWTDTILDYSSLRVCTLESQTGAANKWYGIVPSDLPEVFHPLIAEKTIIELKRQPMSTLRVSREDIELFNMNLVESLKSFGSLANSDYTANDIFTAFEPIL
jgi:hypothetical protein